MSMKTVAIMCVALIARAATVCDQVDTDVGPYCRCDASNCDVVPPESPDLRRGDFQLYTSSKTKLGFWLSQGRFANFGDVGADNVVDLSTRRQTVVGFGGAFTDAAGINIASLSAEAQARLLEAYFGSAGVGYSLGRVPIGGTDFSLEGYTYCDDKDETLRSFALRDADTEYKIPYVRRALDLRGEDNLKLFASAWSAPVWMKNTDKLNGFGKIDPKYYGLWAEYYLKFFDAYRRRNVTFWGVTTQNEPINGLIGSAVQNDGFDAEEMKKWIKEALGPAIRNSTYSHLKIILHDDQRLFLPLLKWLVLSDDEVANYADGIGVHYYTDSIAPGDFLDFATAANGKPLFRLATEACEGSTHSIGLTKAVDLGSWARAESYLDSIFTDLRHDVVGWVDWNLALNASGGPNWIHNEVDSAIIVDAAGDRFYKQPMFYALGHFSRFVVPGSVRVEGGATGEVEALSFRRPDGKVVVVMWNKSSEEKSFTVTVEDLSKNFNLAAKSVNSLLLGL